MNAFVVNSCRPLARIYRVGPAFLQGGIIMKTRLAAAIVAIASVLPMLMSTTATAQQRTWVSGIGSDSNPCSRTAPCKTFAAAISVTSANGIINCLDPGGFGAVTITKSITLDCAGISGGILATGGGNGINVNGSNIVVVVKGLTISGAGSGTTGINFVNGSTLNIVDSHINGFASAIYFTPPTGVNAKLIATNSSFSNNSGGSINILPAGTGTAKVVLNNVQIDNNAAGIYAAAAASAKTYIAIRGSSLSANTYYGIAADGSGGLVTASIQDSVVAANGTLGIYSAGSNAQVAVGRTLVTSNSTGLSAVSSGQLLSYGNNNNNLNITSNGAPSAPVGSPSTANGEQ